MLKILKLLGYRADGAANGIEAILGRERQPYYLFRQKSNLANTEEINLKF
jgi:hypothetical protein